MVTVALYGKPGCHLCEQALDVLLSVQAEINFRLVEINILDDDEIFAEYAESIPVVEIGDAYFCRYHVEPAEFRERLLKEQSLECESEPKS